MKFGGTSVADAERITSVAGRIAAARESGDQVVVVVSARGNTTDELVAAAHEISERPDPREMDMLLSTGERISCALMAMALHDLGHDATSFTGSQAGILTDTSHTKARIVDINPERLREALDDGRIVLVAGFQGVSTERDVTTLGRGGSDTTAVALAAALDADVCEIYTDVKGVYTADPRIVPEARKLQDISYEEMLELAAWGAKVMHPRAVELGAVYNVPIYVASSFKDTPGTLIHGGQLMEQRNKVMGIAQDTDVARITIRGVPDRPGIAAALFQPLGDNGVSVDTIVQNASVERFTDLTFTVSRPDMNRAMEIVKPVAKEIGASEVMADTHLAKVSIVGAGMTSGTGYAGRMFRALFDAKVNIELITTSEIRITCLIDEAQVPKAVRALHKAFQLERQGP